MSFQFINHAGTPIAQHQVSKDIPFTSSSHRFVFLSLTPSRLVSPYPQGQDDHPTVAYHHPIQAPAPLPPPFSVLLTISLHSTNYRPYRGEKLIFPRWRDPQNPYRRHWNVNNVPTLVRYQRIDGEIEETGRLTEGEILDAKKLSNLIGKRN